MVQKSDPLRTAPVPVTTTPTAQMLKGAIDSGRTGDKVDFADPGAAPLGTDDEAAGTADTAARVALAMLQELEQGSIANSEDRTSAGVHRGIASTARSRPKSPTIQIYRLQLTSVLSILNRLKGIFLSACSVALVIWLAAAADGPHAYEAMRGAIASSIGQVLLFGATFAFFLHFFGGIRHLVWDTVHGFGLRSIYISGWIVVVTSAVLRRRRGGLSLAVGR